MTRVVYDCIIAYAGRYCLKKRNGEKKNKKKNFWTNKAITNKSVTEKVTKKA